MTLPTFSVAVLSQATVMMGAFLSLNPPYGPAKNRSRIFPHSAHAPRMAVFAFPAPGLGAIMANRLYVETEIELSTERFYSGGNDGQVSVREGEDERPLDPRYDLRRYAAFFAWGRTRPIEAGAAQLALALLADALGDDDRAKLHREQFEHRVISIMPNRWTISRPRIVAHVAMFERRALTGIPEDKGRDYELLVPILPDAPRRLTALKRAG
jgi:hypothetical protein